MTSTSTTLGAVEPLHDGEDSLVLLYSPKVADPALVGVLQPLPCRVAAIPLGRDMTDDLWIRAPNVLVVDHSTDDFNVVRVVRELDQVTSALIVVVASAADAADEGWLIDRLNDGVHLVIPTTASSELVVAQLRAILRAAPRPQRGPELLTVGDVTIDLGAHSLVIDGRSVSCSPVLFSLLVVLASSPNRVLPRETLLGRVWGVSPTTAHLRRVRIAASQLRRLLGEGPRRPRIETVARVGYCLAVDT